MKSWFHSFLFAAYPILLLYSFNMHEVEPVEILIPLVLVTLVTVVILGLGSIRSAQQKWAICLSAFWFFFLCYGYIYELLSFMRNIFVIGLCGIALGGIAYNVFFRAKNLDRLSQVFTGFGGILVAMTLISILINIATTDVFVRPTPVPVNPIENASERPEPAPDARDIYYLIFDRYASAKNLKKYYGFDNTAFINRLEQTGFYVAHDTYANYPKTTHSISSSLNMDYLDSLAQEMGPNNNNWGPLFSNIQEHKIWKFLKSRGYRYYHLGSFSKESEHNIHADVNISYAVFPMMGFYTSQEFLTVLYRTTPLFHIGQKYAVDSYNFDKTHWRRVFYKLDELRKIAELKETTFVYAHFLIPHPPYIFTRDGAFKIHAEKEADYMFIDRYDPAAYIEQVIFTNREIQKLISDILASSDREPIIIIQGDEGPWPERYAPDYKEFNWREATDAELDEKAGILNAYYLPDKEISGLYPSISPVNTFRLIFNLYFGTSHTLLPDESYCYRDEDHPYDLFPITDRLSIRKVDQ